MGLFFFFFNNTSIISVKKTIQISNSGIYLFIKKDLHFCCCNQGIIIYILYTTLFLLLLLVGPKSKDPIQCLLEERKKDKKEKIHKEFSFFVSLLCLVHFFFALYLIVLFSGLEIEGKSHKFAKRCFNQPQQNWMRTVNPSNPPVIKRKSMDNRNSNLFQSLFFALHLSNLTLSIYLIPPIHQGFIIKFKIYFIYCKPRIHEGYIITFNNLFYIL